MFILIFTLSPSLQPVVIDTHKRAPATTPTHISLVARDANDPCCIVILTRSVHVGIKAISAGDYHSMVLGKDGSVWATGWNLWGTLGDNTILDRKFFVKVLPYGQCLGFYIRRFIIAPFRNTLA